MAVRHLCPPPEKRSVFSFAPSFFMKNAFIKVSALSILLAGVCRAEFQVGNGAFQLDTTLMGVYDSNLRASVNNVEDYYLSFDPTLRYRNTDARFNTEASLGLRARRYLDNAELNTNDANGQFDWKMARVDGHTTAASLGLIYLENTEANLDVNDLVRSKEFSANASGEVLVANRNLLSAAFSYNDDRRNIGSNQTRTNTRLGYGYEGFTDGTELLFNYTYQQSKSTENKTDAETIDQNANAVSATLSHPLYDQLVGALVYGYRWLDRGQNEALLGLEDQSGSFYNIELKGQFLPKKYFPKMTGTFRLAYEEADTPGLNDLSNKRVVGQANVTWAAREHTLVGVFVSRSQDLSITDNTIVNENVGVTLKQAVGDFINTDFSLVHTNADFVNLDRTDNRYEARAGASYKINRLWSSGVSYRYIDSKSNTSVANYTRHIVTGTVTYAF
jgi:opacity protein-like surface antigen